MSAMPRSCGAATALPCTGTSRDPAEPPEGRAARGPQRIQLGSRPTHTDTPGDRQGIFLSLRSAEPVLATSSRSNEPLSVQIIQFSVGCAAAVANVARVALQGMTS